MKKLTLIAAALFATAPVLTAQTGTITFVNGGSASDGHFYVGNYNAALDGAPITVNCVDFFHEVTNGDTWAVTEWPLLGPLTGTRLGTSGGNRYKEGAFLTGQYAGKSNTDIVDIQHAIWRLFGATDSNLVNSGSDAWLAFANANFASSSFDYSNFQILTDTRVGDGVTADALTRQEFLTSTPEPSSLALLGTGLFGLVPMARRRRKS